MLQCSHFFTCRSFRPYLAPPSLRCLCMADKDIATFFTRTIWSTTMLVSRGEEQGTKFLIPEFLFIWNWMLWCVGTFVSQLWFDIPSAQPGNEWTFHRLSQGMKDIGRQGNVSTTITCPRPQKLEDWFHAAHAICTKDGQGLKISLLTKLWQFIVKSVHLQAFCIPVGFKSWKTSTLLNMGCHHLENCRHHGVVVATQTMKLLSEKNAWCKWRQQWQTKQVEPH